jgi:predicted RNase H-like HicB family nuclease
MEFLVVIERGATSFGASVPDLPGCVAVGESQAEVEALIREAIEFHIEGLREGDARCRNQRPLAKSSRSTHNMPPSEQMGCRSDSEDRRQETIWIGW